MRLPIALLMGTVLLGLAASAAEPQVPFYADKTKLLVFLDADGKEQPIRDKADWPKRRAHIVANMQRVMGPLPPQEHKVPLDMKVEQEVQVPHVVRKKITFAVEK